MTSRFDIDRFMEQSGAVELDDIAWEDVPKYPLTPEALRALRYFMTTESATFYYLRGLIQTKPALAEPEFAPFLCAWAFEEEFHGRAFHKFMRAYGVDVDEDYRAKMYSRRTGGERKDEIGQFLLSVLFPEAWPAAHMAWGAIQEWTTYTAYTQLIQRTGHPILETICRRIMKQELRHFSFYYHQAEERLRSSRFAQELTSRTLKFAWTPVGDGMSSKDDVAHALQYLFDGAEGTAVATIEKKIRQLPGLEWFDLLSRYVSRNGIRRAPESWFDRSRVESAAVLA
ncbi:MAG: acyl-ACP desaturase [Deltaproteobacteria bacterium]|nr:acyl-ACP desaturase [Deltaproteobacteria bacterium]